MQAGRGGLSGNDVVGIGAVLALVADTQDLPASSIQDPAVLRSLRHDWNKLSLLRCGFFLSRLRGFLVRIEGCIAVIDAVKALPGVEQLGTKLLMKGIPHLDGYEGLSAEEQGKGFALPTEVRHLPMDELIFDQAANLPVNHPVKLSDQDDVIPELSMLRKEGQPLGPS